ncbi:MAG: hypothetical protein ACFB6S_07865 [Geminicoccaceae bacterium]
MATESIGDRAGRAIGGLIVGVICGVFVIAAIIALTQGIFLLWLKAVDPAWAYILSAATYLVITGLLWGCFALTRHRRVRYRSPALPLSSSLKAFGPIAGAVKDRPATAVMVAALAGVLLEQIERRRR